MSKTKQPSSYVFRSVPRVIDLGSVRDVVGHTTRLLDFAVLGIVTAGELHVEVGEERLSAGVGHYYLLPQLVPHGGFDTATFDAVFYHFVLAGDVRPPDAPAEPPPGDRPVPAIELPLAGPTPPLVDYAALFRILEGQYRTGLLDGDELGLQLLAIAGQFAAAHRRQVSAPADPAHSLARTVLELLHTDYPHELRGPAIAARLGYSYAYLEKVFRATYDRSIHQELLRTRIQAASHGLQMGKPIKDVAREAGFGDYYYFLKAFKRATGVSPGAFQASFRARGRR
ncbi:MAG TPA: AraC family transcriptional regulator [Streptosporangiaceae bacterium]|jgi:AraC-like DNA-binding protein|nr:AraC family transcriptional regulator [Streptosporangiaceae bacterium]